MSRSFDLRLLGRNVRVYLSDFKGDLGYEKGLHGRASLWLDESSNRVAGLEWHIPTRSFGTRISVGHDDSPFNASLSTLIFGLYASVDAPWLRIARDKILKWLPSDMGRNYSGRKFSVSVHDFAVWWSLGVDDMGWTSKRPRWRDGCWHPLGHLMRQGEPREVEERAVLVPMPERSYRASARLEQTRWGFTKLPRFFDRIDYHVDLKMAEGEQIPFPGKGESAHDCGDDAAFGIYGPARTIEDGVGRMVASVMRSRVRHGGTNWQPEKPEAAS